MSAVLTKFREKNPAYADRSDEELVRVLAQKYPAYLEQEDFRREVGLTVMKPVMSWQSPKEFSGAYGEATETQQPTFAPLPDTAAAEPWRNAMRPRDPAQDTYEAQLGQVGVTAEQAASEQERAEMRQEQIFPGLPDSGLGGTPAKMRQAFARGTAQLSETLNRSIASVLDWTDRSPAFAVFRGHGLSGWRHDTAEYMGDTANELRKGVVKDLQLVEAATPGSKMAADVAGAVPSLVPSMATAPVAGLPILMAGFQSYGSVLGDAEEGFRKQGMPEDQVREKSRNVAALNGFGTALLTFGFNRFGPGLEKWTQGMTQSGTRAAMKHIGKEFGFEFTEEGLDQFQQGLLARHTYDPTKSWREIVNESLTAAVAGGTLAGGLGSVTHMDDQVRLLSELTGDDKTFSALSQRVANDTAALGSLPPQGFNYNRPRDQSLDVAPPGTFGGFRPGDVFQPGDFAAPGASPTGPTGPTRPTGLTPTPPAPVPGSVPTPVPAPAPAPPPPVPAVIPGRKTTILGANDAKIPAVYAWAPASQIQASHVGESFSQNPLYAPLKNTRRYHEDQAERDKVLKGAAQFNPQSYATNVRGAAEGPVMVSEGDDGVLRVLGGNGRFQMISRLSPEQREEFGAIQDEEAGVFGLPPRPSPDHLLVRMVPKVDLSTPAGVAEANRTVDLLNPSPGLVESTASMARNDAAKIPAPLLTQIRHDSGPAAMRAWMRDLIENGTLDRNTRTQIASNDEQMGDYVRRVLVQAAYHSDVVNEFRADRKTRETTRGLIDSGIPLLLAVRDKGEPAIAQAFTELVTRTADYQKDNTELKLDDILRTIHSQAEGLEGPQGPITRALALALSNQVERLPPNKRGERKIDPDETQKNFATFFDALTASVKGAEVLPDLFGGHRSVEQVITDFLRARNGDAEPPALQEAPRGNPLAARLNKLAAVAKTRKLTKTEETERAGIEVALGQNFMGFWNNEQGAEEQAAEAAKVAAEEQRLQIAARQSRRLVGGAIESQGELLGPQPGQGDLLAGPTAESGKAGKRESGMAGEAPPAPGGQLTLLEEPATVGPDETPQAIEERRRKYKADPRQLEFDAIAAARQIAAGANLLQRAGAGRGVAGGLPGISLFAKRITDKFIHDGKIDIVGHKVRSVEEAAVVAQVFRNPLFEVFHYIFTKRGEVVGRYAVSAQMPGTTYALAHGHHYDTINRMSVGLGADEVHALHNHPSGNPVASTPDLTTTPGLYRNIHGLKSHIIIDHTTYTVIDEHGNETLHKLPGPHTEFDPLHAPVANQPLGKLLGKMVITPGQLAAMGKEVAAHLSRDVVSLIFTDARAITRALGEVSTADLLDKAALIDNLRKTALSQGASNVMAYYEGTTPVLAALEDYVREGLLRDAFAPAQHLNSVHQRGIGYLLPGTTIRGDPGEQWIGLPYSPKLGQRIAEDYAEYEATPTVTTPAITITFATVKGKPATTPMVLGGMQHVKPVEMPEIVRLAKELLGHTPGLKRFPRAAGMFYHGSGGPYGVTIKLHPDIFRNSDDAAKVLAHELGHLIDYLPNHTMRRGNLVGRLNTLRDFLHDMLGPGGVSNKDLREELIALTQFWHPYDPATVPESYKKYRESAKELYADALSVLLNSPGLLEQMAPKFYKEFWRKIDRKPEVKQSLFDLQDLLNKGKVPVLEQRKADRETMYVEGDRILKRKAAEREARRKSWKGYWLELKQTIFDKFEPVIAKANEAAGKGATFSPKLDPRNILEEGAMTDNANSRMVRRIFEGVVKPVEDVGITMNQFGDYLFLRRVLAGDRSPLANPMGTTPATARLDLLKMRLDTGMGRMTILEAAVQKFHDIVFESVKEAVRVGSYNQEVFRTRIEPNKDVYAAFAVLDYLEDYVPAGIKNQIGTLKDIANPFTATVLKTISLNNLNSIQRSKNGTRDLLRTHFPAEIEEAKGRFLAPGFTARPVPKADRGIFEVLEDGRPAFYYVDPLIATAFERQTPGGLERTLRVLDYVFRKGIYRLWITYSPSFLLFNPQRDFWRTYTNLPGGVKGAVTGLPRLARAYYDAFGTALSHVRGIPDGTATEMLANYAIGTPQDTLVSGHRDDPFSDLLRRFRVLAPAEQPAFMDRWFMTPIAMLARGMEFFGQLQETLPKVAAYRMMREQFGLGPREAAQHVRNYAGTPNVFKRGTATRVIRPVVPFFNVFAQGMRADIHKMNPKTMSGWFFKWAATDGIWAVLAGLASAGVLGAALKSLFGGMSEYDKTNYNTIPIGTTAGGDFGKKVTYLRFPRHETSRLLSGMTYKLTRQLAGDSPEQFTDVLAFGAGQLPGVNPVITIPEKWAELATGHNPTDAFRGRDIIRRDAYEAGGFNVETMKDMGMWTLDQTGAGNIVKWNPHAETTMELALSAIPGIKSLVKTTDYGYREAQEAKERIDEKLRAQHRLDLPDDVRKLTLEHSHLQSIDKTRRTPEQAARYATLTIWHNTVYRENDEALSALEKSGNSAQAAALRRTMSALSKGYVK